MKSPSLQSLFSSFVYALRRFPFEIFFTLLGVIAATVNIELSGIHGDASAWCIRLLMISVLGLVLSLSATLFAESRSFNRTQKYALRAFAALTAFLFLLVFREVYRESEIVRFLIFAAAFHLLVSFAAFAGRDHINAFWQFNRALFLRFLAGVLYSAVLYLGLSATIGSMNLLFNFQFQWDTFAILWIWIAGLFQTVFFLSGIPENVNALEGDKSYPKGLKVFTQYVLIPLASVYVGILLAYELKIIVEGELPKGLVSSLILAYAVFGILSLLLIYPVRNLQENKWFKTYSRNFYFLMIPLIFLLVWAVTVRIRDYGLTEQRYFLIILAIWLVFITAYFLLSKRQDIRSIPVTLCVVALISAFGPQSAFALSRSSQINQVKGLFKKYNAHREGRIIPLTVPVDSADSERMANILRYLMMDHGVESVYSLSNVNVESIERYYTDRVNQDSVNLRFVRSQIAENVRDSLSKRLHIRFREDYGIESSRVLNFKISNEDVADITGYKRMISFNSNSAAATEKPLEFTLDGKTFILKILNDRLIISDGKNSASFNLARQLESLLSKSAEFKKADHAFILVPDRQMITDEKVGAIQMRLVLQGIQGGYRKPQKNDLYVLYYHGILLVK